MMRHEPALDLSIVAPLGELAEKIARTDFVPTSFRGKPEAILAAMLTGQELGLPPMQSLSKIHVVDGRPGLSSELMRALILRAGHELWIENKTTTRVTVCGQRKGSGKVSKVTWSLDDAKRAGLEGRQNWRKFPRAMLTARATGELARDVFPDVVAGLYSVEELEDGFDEDVPRINAETLEVEEPKANTRKARGATAKTSGTRAKAKPEKVQPPAPDFDEVKVLEVTEIKVPGRINDNAPPPDPFDDETPEQETARQEAAEAKIVEVFGGADVETDEVASEADAEKLRGMIAQLDEEQRAALGVAWRNAHFGSIKAGSPITLTAKQAGEALEMLTEALDAQAAIYLRRQKAVNAQLGEAGIKGDAERHAFIKAATGGETESTKGLLGRQVKAIKAALDDLGRVDEPPPDGDF